MMFDELLGFPRPDAGLVCAGLMTFDEIVEVSSIGHRAADAPD